MLPDLKDAPPEDVQVGRTRVAVHRWGSRLLALQGQPWTATTYSLLLRDFGLDPRSREARSAIALVRESSRWEEGDEPFFHEMEPCINGMTVALGAIRRHPADGAMRLE